MQSDKQARRARPASFTPGRRRAATVLTLVALAVPIGLVLQSGTDSTRTSVRGRPVEVGTQPGRIVAEAIRFVASTSTTVTTAAPTTAAPITTAPVTEPPTTAPPATEPPVTEPPTTEPPVTAAPTTSPPTTQAPTTQAPTTQAPTTQAPTTQAPTTQAPTTQGPQTTASSGGGAQRTVHSTAYCTSGTTASGAYTSSGSAAMNGVALGSRWRVVGTGAIYTITDRIGSGSEFDIFMPDCGSANAYGRQSLTIQQVG